MTRLVLGRGVNDAPYTVKKDGWVCPYWRAWSDMMTRAYSPAYHKKRPTYKDVEVCEEWLTFSNFKMWAEKQPRFTIFSTDPYHLDKDLKNPGSKLYSPDNCMFVSPQVNTLMESCKATRGDLPIGVDRFKDKYRARCSVYGRSSYLGLFETKEEAHAAWQKAKAENIVQHLYTVFTQDEKDCLQSFADKLLDDWSNGVETIL